MSSIPTATTTLPQLQLRKTIKIHEQKPSAAKPTEAKRRSGEAKLPGAKERFGLPYPPERSEGPDYVFKVEKAVEKMKKRLFIMLLVYSRLYIKVVSDAQTFSF
ncbi:hypothetical protein V8F20_011476 [Naviculisporaceae sp. PSN 640]